MNAKDFDEIVAARMAWCNKTLCAKGDEYARDGDRLWNFKVAARKMDCHPAQALAGMMVKHTVSVDDIIDGLAHGIVPPRELVAEKIGDSINYLLLLEGLIEEERRESERVGVVPANRYLEKLRELRRGLEPSATSDEQARDAAKDAMATSLRYAEPKLCFRGDDPDVGIIAIDGKSDPFGSGYTAPPPQDGDDDPVVHIVPDRSSRATLPYDRPMCPEDAL